MDAAVEGFTRHNPGTWAKQAELAYQEKWQELKNWQDILTEEKKSYKH